MGHTHQALTRLALVYPAIAAPEYQVVDLLMPARRGGVALGAALVPLGTRNAAVADGVPATDDTVRARASPARVAAGCQRVAVRDLSVLEPTTCESSALASKG